MSLVLACTYPATICTRKTGSGEICWTEASFLILFSFCIWDAICFMDKFAPLGAVTSNCFPIVRINATLLHGNLQLIIISFELSALLSVTGWKLTIQRILEGGCLLCDEMPRPSKPHFNTNTELALFSNSMLGTSSCQRIERMECRHLKWKASPALMWHL